MIFAISDIHGAYDLFKERVEQLEPYLENGDKLILLGDYIDRGYDSCGCLRLAKELQDKYGKEQVIALKGNHEVWFLDFLISQGNDWLAEDERFCTSKTFLTDDEYEGLKLLGNREQILDYIRSTIKKSHRELLQWTSNLPLYYENATQIFVHAGVDEDIPEEEIEYCTLATGDYIFTGKYPPTKGKFYKDIIAGHVAASKVAKDNSLQGIYFDGFSHFYIDGSANKNRRLLCLGYDEETGCYYDFGLDGSKKILKENR